MTCPECGHERTAGEAAKVGTKVRNIRLAPGSDHDIDCRIDGFDRRGLKSAFVKKAT